MISKSGIHAVRALIALAELPDGTYAGAVSIAEQIDAPKNYLGKLLQQLSREGIVTSQKGMGGGFRLARKPEDVSLRDVVEPIEQVGKWNGCILGRPSCSELNPCVIHNRWKLVKESYLKLLNETTLADLVTRQKEG